jgi:hypothetical protein
VPSATDAVIKQINQLLAEYAQLSGGAPDAGTLLSGRPDAEVKALRMRLAAAVERLAPPKSAYVAEAKGLSGTVDAYAADALSGILLALRADFQDGYMRTIEELVHAELFADFLDMADELVGKGYKAAAAVVAGSVLEEHLRKLAGVHGVSTKAGSGHKKADTINADLVKASAYNKLEQKNVTAWLGLRNDAAHGKYGNYDQKQVEALIRDVRDFATRHPA